MLGILIVLLALIVLVFVLVWLMVMLMQRVHALEVKEIRRENKVKKSGLSEGRAGERLD